MIGTLQCVVLDCPEPLQLAVFYETLVGGEVNRPDPRRRVSDNWATLHVPGGQVLCFQRAADHLPPRRPDPAHPQQAHLDLAVDDLDAAEAQVLAAGATALPEEDLPKTWRVYADPVGHPFCLIRD